MKASVSKLESRVASLKAAEQARYHSAQQSLPADAEKQLSALELLAETVSASVDDKEREMKRARTMRYDFTSDVEFVQSWLQQAEAKIMDKTETPENLRRHMQVRP